MNANQIYESNLYSLCYIGYYHFHSAKLYNDMRRAFNWSYYAPYDIQQINSVCMRCVFDADTVADSAIESYVTWEHELFVYLSIHGKHDHLMFAIYIQASKKMIIVWSILSKEYSYHHSFFFCIVYREMFA